MVIACPFCASSESRARSSMSCPLAADLADEERMDFLTSSVGPGDVNARDQVVSFWCKVIDHACQEAPSLSVDMNTLGATSLGWGGASPHGLQLATDVMISSGRIFERNVLEKGEAGFAKRLVMVPLLYLARTTGLGALAKNSGPRQYVNRDVLQALAKEIVEFCQHLPLEERTVFLLATAQTKPFGPSTEGASWCFEQLCRAAGEAAAVRVDRSASENDMTPRMLLRLSKDDIVLLAGYLVTTKQAVLEEDEGVLKILSEGGGRGGAAAREATISETDKDLLRLRSTVACLEMSISDLGQRIRRAQDDALREKRAGQKRAALVHLRRTKQFQATRDKRLSSLFTLETALHRVTQLRVDKQVLEAHEAATSALKACREEGLSIDRVEDTMDALAEEMAEQEAVGAALAQDTSCKDDLDAELEAELEALTVAEDAETTDGKATLPTAPTRATPAPTGASAVRGASAQESQQPVARVSTGDGGAIKLVPA